MLLEQSYVLTLNAVVAPFSENSSAKDMQIFLSIALIIRPTRQLKNKSVRKNI